MKQILIMALGLGMLFFHQNCGMAKAPQTTSTDTAGIIDRGVQSDSQTQILTQVMDGYSQCERSGVAGAQWTSCQRNVIEKAQATGVAAAEGTQKAPFCYVFGPQCKQPQNDMSDAQLIQSCRRELVESGFSEEVLATLAKMDPVGYAVLMNTECLYKKRSCVIAVKCS